MGSAKRKQPDLLGQKLMQIRQRFGYSYAQMAQALSDDELMIPRTDIERFEKAIREPTLLLLLRYSKLVRLSLEAFVDDAVQIDDFNTLIFKGNENIKIESDSKDTYNKYIFINLDEGIIRSINAKNVESDILGIDGLVRRFISSLSMDEDTLVKLGAFLKKLQNEFPALVNDNKGTGLKVLLSIDEFADLTDKSLKARMNPREFVAYLLIAWWLGRFDDFLNSLTELEQREKDHVFRRIP